MALIPLQGPPTYTAPSTLPATTTGDFKPGTTPQGKLEEPEANTTKYTLQLDPYFMAPSGADNTFTAYKLANNYALAPLSDATGMESHWYGRIGRGFLNFSLALYLGGVQHEFYGHGGRTREAGCTPSHDFRLWRGKFGGITNCSNLNASQMLFDAMGGTEANQVLSKAVGEEMLLYGGNVFYALLYLDTKLDITNYILNWNNPSFASTSPFSTKDQTYPFKGDIDRYWYLSTWLRKREMGKTHSAKEIQEEWNGPSFSYYNIPVGAVWNMVDPHLIWLGYQTIRYLVTGNQGFETPDFLPRTNFVLGPQGPLYYLSFPFTAGNPRVLFEPYINSTVNTVDSNDNTLGFGTDVLNVHFSSLPNVAFRGSFNLWKTPEKWGGSNTLGIALEPKKRYRPSWGFDITGKTEGYVLGLPYESGFYADVKLASRF